MSTNRSIYLHIGTEKTGTTAIQYACGKNRVRLQQDGICYPEAAGPQNHIRLAAYVADQARSGSLRREVGLSGQEAWDEFRQSFPDVLRAEIEQSACSTVVLSTEFLSSQIRHLAELRRLADMLQPLGAIKIVCYLRPQHEMFLSWDSTFIKSGGTHHTTPPETDGDYVYNYLMMLGLWADVFGDANIIVRVYDRRLLAGGDVVEDFFSILGYRPDPPFEVAENLNQRLDSDTLQFLLLLNRHLPRFQEDMRNLERGDVVTALEAIASGPKERADSEVLRRIAGLFEPSNAAVARRFLGRADGVLFPNLKIVEEPGGNGLTAERSVEIAAHLWQWKMRQLLGARRRIEHLLKRVERAEARARRKIPVH